MKFGSKNPVGGIKAKVLNKLRKEEKMTDPLDALADQGATPLDISDQAISKKKSPAQAQKSEINAMQYRAKSRNAMQAGGRMRASDIKLGSRKSGAY